MRRYAEIPQANLVFIWFPLHKESTLEPQGLPLPSKMSHDASWRDSVRQHES